MLSLFNDFLNGLQPILVPVCLTFAWGFLLLLALSFISWVRDVSITAKLMHQIPCTNCQFFTGDYLLKCTVHPHTANTEEAIDCRDYWSQ